MKLFHRLFLSLLSMCLLVSAAISNPQPVIAVTQQCLAKKSISLWLPRYYPTPHESQLMDSDMRALEKRCAEQLPGTTEADDTYQQVLRLLSEPSYPQITYAQRLALAMQVLHHAAYPSSVDQGRHNTCELCLENIVYTRHPSKAAKLVADVALTGHYRLADGIHVVYLDRNGDQSLVPDAEAADYKIDKAVTDYKRSFAGQIFQVTAANIPLVVQNSSKRYMQLPGTFSADDFGERLIDSSLPEGQQVVAKAPVLGIDKIPEIYRQIVGDDADQIRIIAKTESAYPGVTQVSSVSQLHGLLSELKTKKSFPVVVRIQVKGNEPFWSDARHINQNGWHMLCIKDYNPNTGWVGIDNQWGEICDHLSEFGPDRRKVNVYQLFDAIVDKAGHQNTPNIKAGQNKAK